MAGVLVVLVASAQESPQGPGPENASVTHLIAELDARNNDPEVCRDIARQSSRAAREICWDDVVPVDSEAHNHDRHNSAQHRSRPSGEQVVST